VVSSHEESFGEAEKAFFLNHRWNREIWVTAQNAYNERVSHVENQIIARLRDRLGGTM
jgi:hypothetical protein